MNELCFVWGAPLSGQMCWMARAAQETDPKAAVSLLPIENHSAEPELFEIFKNTERAMAKTLPNEMAHHIYCELPWRVTEEGLELEDWLATRPEFAKGSSTWNLNFVCLVPFDADRLPRVYREGLEEFTRASRSAAIILRSEGQPEEPDWIGTDVLDFGRNGEVYEEVLWPKPSTQRLEPQEALTVPVFEIITMPLTGERATFEELFRGLDRGDYGDIWAAEAYWKNKDGLFEAMTLTQGYIFDWVSDNPSLIETTVANGAMLNIIGGPLKKTQILQNLRSQSFC